MRRTTTKAAPKARRADLLKAILESRRFELVHELRTRIRAVRSDGHAHRDVLDDADGSEADTQDDIGFALIQLKTETLTQIDAALRRLEDGHYGNCFECGGNIAEARSHSPSAAGTANKAARRQMNVSASWDGVVAPPISSSMEAASLRPRDGSERHSMHT